MSIDPNIFKNPDKQTESGESPIRQFLENNFPKILIVVIMLMSYVQLRYEYEEHVVNVSRLKREINDIRYTSIAKWGQLTQQSRPENIRGRIANSNVNLIESNEPPISIE